ncbi:MAG TPA: FAD-binding oxidoreductase [Steroidobacteraceae bacterium]|nr:FAD-binding oxidoreductase [Steroidobacteraceae bacterium]
MPRVSSWGNTSSAEHALIDIGSRFEPFPAAPNGLLLPFGNGRSYGDCCLNPGGGLVRMRQLDRLIRFDRERGILECEAGVLLEEILRIAVPAGWFLPVTPGTRLVTVGGAIANDVHGKNHHRAGTFGCHVRRLTLLRSDRGRLECSATENADLFSATIGGLGLTGLILSAEVVLRPIPGRWLEVETIPFGGVDEFMQLSAESDRTHEYTVAWIDCGAAGRRLGRGIFQRADHAPCEPRQSRPRGRRRRPLEIPFVPPVSAVNRCTARAFSILYYHRQRGRAGRRPVPYEPFFYPLDGLGSWNRLYGPSGFHQYQCVLPGAAARDSLQALLDEISRARVGTFLSVLKGFGERQSPGLLSFPQPGVTLAVDFPSSAARTASLLARCDSLVAAAGGRLYPAKDARMPSALYKAGYPRWREFATFVDSRCSSAFWRRVAQAE